MLEVASWIYFTFAVICFVHAVIWNIINLSHEIKEYCFLKQHWSLENYFKYYYEKYYDHEVPTAEDIQLLRNYLTELKEQQDLHQRTL